MLKNINVSDFWKKIIKGCLFATILSVFFVLIFALIMRIFSLNADIVPAVNVIIKSNNKVDVKRRISRRNSFSFVANYQNIML